MRTHACTCTNWHKAICFPAAGTGLVLLTTGSRRAVSALEIQSKRERPFRTHGRLRGSVEQPCQATLRLPKNCARKTWMPWRRKGKREQQFRGPLRRQENFERTACLRWWNLHFASSTDAVPKQRCSFTWVHGIMLHPKAQCVRRANRPQLARVSHAKCSSTVLRPHRSEPT